MENALLSLETDSIVAGLRALQSLPKVKLIDAEPIGGGRFLLLARGGASTLRTFAKEQTDVVDFEVIEDLSQDVLDAIYSLAPGKLGEALVVAETETATTIISLAQMLVIEHKLNPVEIKIRKSGPGGAYAYFTGPSSACTAAAVEARTHLARRVRKGSVEAFDQPSRALRSLFED